MTNPIGRFHNLESGEVIDRQLTDAELQNLLRITDESSTTSATPPA